MAGYVGDIRLGDTIDVKFTTVGTTGAPTTLAGSPVISAYPGNSTTQLTAGITLTVDFDSVTGYHNVRVVASSGNGYATATNYSLAITTGTVGGTPVVGYEVGAFSIENRSALMPTTAAQTLDVSAGGEAGVDWGNVGSKTTSNALTGTTIATTQKVDIETIKTNPVVNGGTITFPTTATLASTTNITAATGIDVTKWNGTTVSTPATAGIPDVNVKNVNNVAATSVTTINANLGTTQPVNFTGTGGSALAKADMVDIAGAAVSTTSAQIGTNAVQINAVSTSSVTAVNANVGTTQPVNFTGTAGSALVKSDMVDIAGAAVSTSSAQIGVNVIQAAGTAWNSGAIGASTLASDTITAAKIADNAIDRATFAADTGLQSIRSNTATAGAGTTITLDASASAVDDFYKNATIYLTGGTGVGQARFITGYVGSTKVATVATWATNPDNTTTFAILPYEASAASTPPTTAQIATAVWTDLLAGSDFSTSASIGKLLKDDIDAAVSSRMATYTQPMGFLAATFPSGTIANTTNITAGTITTATNLTTNNDKTGYRLSATGVDDIWDDAVDGSVTARQSLRLANSANGAILSGAATTTVTIRDLADTKDRVTATVDASGNRTAVTRDLT